jgi:tricorn protease
MVSELSALHHFVSGGDMRRGDDNVQIASLGARLSRDEAAGGFRVSHIAITDPDEPTAAAPLARPGVNIKVGDVIRQVNGIPALSVPDLSVLLRQKAGRQVLLRVADGAGAERDVIVEPISSGAAANMRYDEWEYTRRLRTEALSKGQVGYVHLRAMGTGDMAQFVRDFYPVFHKPGLVIDVRDNGGGNIDSWILSRLLRKSWFFWNQRVGRSNSWNMQYAFRGHVVVLCNEHTGSDGEAFAEGIRRLNIGTVLGTRTWGGEIWLTSSNVLVDRGLASAAEFGVFGPEGTWLIEGHGVEPDVVVDNLPVETYRGEDKQLDAAVNLLIEKIAKDPRTIPPVPALPDKRFKK